MNFISCSFSISDSLRLPIYTCVIFDELVVVVQRIWDILLMCSNHSVSVYCWFQFVLLFYTHFVMFDFYWIEQWKTYSFAFCFLNLFIWFHYSIEPGDENALLRHVVYITGLPKEIQNETLAEVFGAACGPIAPVWNFSFLFFDVNLIFCLGRCTFAETENLGL